MEEVDKSVQEARTKRLPRLGKLKPLKGRPKPKLKNLSSKGRKATIKKLAKESVSSADGILVMEDRFEIDGDSGDPIEFSVPGKSLSLVVDAVKNSGIRLKGESRYVNESKGWDDAFVEFFTEQDMAEATDLVNELFSEAISRDKAWAEWSQHEAPDEPIVESDAKGLKCESCGDGPVTNRLCESCESRGWWYDSVGGLHDPSESQ